MDRDLEIAVEKALRQGRLAKLSREEAVVMTAMRAYPDEWLAYEDEIMYMGSMRIRYGKRILMQPLRKMVISLASGVVGYGIEYYKINENGRQAVDLYWGIEGE